MPPSAQTRKKLEGVRKAARLVHGLVDKGEELLDVIERTKYIPPGKLIAGLAKGLAEALEGSPSPQPRRNRR